jgi:tRNA threonylcarbamoyladenosine biosynthesis protein TsaE
MANQLTTSSQETKKIGQRLARSLKGGEVIALFGELGSGKTTFVQGLAKGLGVEQVVTSPSFILMNQFLIPGRKVKLCHFDFYRLKKGVERSPADLTDFLGKKEYISLIEWADRVTEFLPSSTIKIYFKYISSNRRKITINRPK